MSEIQTARPSYEIVNISILWINELFSNNDIDFKYQSYKDELTNILSYFIYYGFIPLHLPQKYSDAERFERALIVLSSAPWMGAISTRYSVPLKILISLDILSFYNPIKKIDCSLSLNISSIFLLKFPDIANEVSIYYKKAMIAHEQRFILHSDLGWTLGAENLKKDILNIINSHRGNIIIKLVAYHGRTWFGVDSSGGFIQDMLGKYNNLYFKILLVDPKADIIVREGATEEEHCKSSQNGMLGINNINKTELKRVDIRLYGGEMNSANLRGMIIEDEKGDLLSVHITNWRFGLERGIYGKELLLHSESSLAKLCNNYFNDVFKNAKPTGKLHKRIAYYIKNNFSFFTLLVLPILAIWLSAIFAKNQEDMIISTILSIAITAWGVIVPTCLKNIYKKR